MPNKKEVKRMSKPYKLTDGYVSPRIEDLKRLIEIGWIDEIDDWEIELDCYGSHDSFNNCCEDCPLEDPCHLIRFHAEEHY